MTEELQSFINDFANGNADDTCRDAFDRLVEYAEELESAYAKAVANNVGKWAYGGPT